METAIVIVILVLMVIGPIAVLKVIGGRGIRLGKRPRTAVRETIVGEVANTISKAEILEEMCLLPWITRETLRSGDRLSDAERTIIAKKSLAGKAVFPVSDTQKGEETEEWLKHPFAGVLIQSMPIDSGTMERILRNILQESFDSSYKTAKARAIGKKTVMTEALRELMEIPPDDWSKRSEILSKAQEACSDIERGGWRKYLVGGEGEG